MLKTSVDGSVLSSFHCQSVPWWALWALQVSYDSNSVLGSYFWVFLTDIPSFHWWLTLSVWSSYPRVLSAVSPSIYLETLTVPLRVPHQRESRDSTVIFNMLNYRTCKNLWRSCVEHHAFFQADASLSLDKKLLFSHGTLSYKHPSKWVRGGAVLLDNGKGKARRQGPKWARCQSLPWAHGEVDSSCQ